MKMLDSIDIPDLGKEHRAGEARGSHGERFASPWVRGPPMQKPTAKKTFAVATTANVVNRDSWGQ